jgi:hypothetical protein
VRRLEKVSLLDTKKLTQAEGEINGNREEKRMRPGLLFIKEGGLSY